MVGRGIGQSGDSVNQVQNKPHGNIRPARTPGSPFSNLSQVVLLIRGAFGRDGSGYEPPPARILDIVPTKPLPSHRHIDTWVEAQSFHDTSAPEAEERFQSAAPDGVW